MLKRKRVEITANGFVYRGILIEATEEEVMLRADTGFVTIQMDRILSVRDPSEKIKMAGNKFIDSSFYDADLTAPPAEDKEKKES